MNERIKKVDAALLEEDLREIFARVFEDDEPTEFETIQVLLADLIIRISRHLAKRAGDGDKKSFSQLFFIAASATGLYQKILNDWPELYERHAIHHETIPILVGRSPDTLEKAEQHVKLSGVGDRIGLAHKGKRKDSVFREIAEELIREILSEMSRLSNLMSGNPFFLPELARNREILDAWWPHVLKRFNSQYGPEIENHTRFAAWRKSMGDRYAPEGRTDSVLRADLRTRLKQAFDHVAASRDDRGRLLQ